jgi:nicotinamide-nucleotide amidase
VAERMSGDDALQELAERVGAALLARSWSVTTAESCTGGWIAKVLTDIAGSSQWFSHGFVTYSNEAKAEMLGVSREVLRTHGAVSRSVVEAMTAGAMQRAGSNCAVAVSGIAGPGGAVPGKPVGTVWLCWRAAGRARARLENFSGDRELVRRQSVAAALCGLLEAIDGAR